jgi:hypothetical protein
MTLAMAGTLPAAGLFASWLIVVIACLLVTVLTVVRWGRLRASERSAAFPKMGR